MPNYEKLTLDRFKLNLKEGKYKNLTGARRAIGKVTDWPAKDRESAQEIASKHFGDAGSTKQAAAKGGKKAGPKKAAKKASAAPKAKKAAAKKASARAESSASTAKQPTARTPVTAKTPEDHRIAAQEMLAFASNVRKELDAHVAASSPEAVNINRAEIVKIVNDAVSHMLKASEALPKPEQVAEAPSQARVEVPVAAAPVAIPEPPQTVGQVSDDNLTEAERRAKELFLKDHPNPLGLPLPQS